MAFYLKYRPQKVSEIDNQIIREKIPALFSSSSFPHAFLFTGPKGIGKTSTARIIAKMLNCEKGSSSQKKWQFCEPCGLCSQCVEIKKGTHLDVLEIDAASNRGIDEIRQLRERIAFAPVFGKYKVYIIDEVHMLTTEAFNALLKTLEEPPKHVLFILCTTELVKIPATIISRCTHLEYTKAKDIELERSLKRVLTGEKLKIDQNALNLIISLADGSFRDGTKLLEQIAAFGKANIALNDIKSSLSIANIQEEKIVSLIIEKKAKEALELICQIISSGTDPKILNKALLINLQRKILDKIKSPKSDTRELINLKKIISLFIKADQDIKYSPVPSLPLELAVIEYCVEGGVS